MRHPCRHYDRSCNDGGHPMKRTGFYHSTGVPAYSEIFSCVDMFLLAYPKYSRKGRREGIESTETKGE